MDLIIVESPTKAKTITQFLGKEFKIESSYGHIRDLPKSKLGIDLENDFEPQYIIPKKAQKNVTALRKISEKSDSVILATDEDREGEAIAWHLMQALKLDIKKTRRIVFHEITESAIQNALKNPREILLPLVNAQQARRTLDRLVGYKLSPFLWKKVVRGLSAGRVQSVALRLIVDREEEIKNFKPEEYWTIAVALDNKKNQFEANLNKINGEVIPKLGIKNEADAKKIVTDLEKSNYIIASIEKNEVKKNPLPPFITSTLQQTASRHFGYSAKKTMFLSQSLYEQGFITYMRTDSVNLSQDALKMANEWIKKNLEPVYNRPARTFKNKSKLAQEAHEAIRPTQANFAPQNLGGDSDQKLSKDEAKVYDLIWRRFIASQLPEAIFDATRVEINATSTKNPSAEKTPPYQLLINGNILRFDGFLKIWPIKFEDKIIPPLKENENLNLIEVKPSEHFTEPPPRYNEASIIKTLEKYGIGRPSTYAPTISVIQERNYVEKIQGRFHPTEIGSLVNKVLTEHFPNIVDIDFTAKMEEELDQIAEGKKKWQNTIREFYEPFAKHLEQKYEEVEKQNPVVETTDEKCEKCGKPMVVKFGRFGKFLACSGFPECKSTKTLKEDPKKIGLQCPKCTEGDIIEKRVNKGRARGKIFWGCSRYPKCDYASWTDPRNPSPEKTEG